ncbi:MAG: NAD(P)H-dependent oxidoreductase [Candidatus Altiarchaeota archaeon]
MAGYRIVGICGSLRKGSYNRMLLHAAKELLPRGATLEEAGIGDITPYNEDDLSDMPDAVKAFKQRVNAADAVLFCSPEYNYSIPGVLKNAIDWASRPTAESVWEGKPAAIMGASTGRFGTVRMQHHLRQVLVGFDANVVCKPEIMISFAKDKFDQGGNLTDEAAKKLIAQLLENLAAVAKRMR